MSPPLEVADIFRNHGAAYLTHTGKRVPMSHRRAMRAIQACRTSDLGGHVDRCEQCGAQRISYNSCRNRHCPKCQFLKAERWVEARKECLLPISYSHVVFTVPQELRAIALRNQRLLYGILFEAASATLRQLSRDPKHLGAEIGFTMVLHTWSQTLASTTTRSTTQEAIQAGRGRACEVRADPENWGLRNNYLNPGRRRAEARPLRTERLVPAR